MHRVIQALALGLLPALALGQGMAKIGELQGEGPATPYDGQPIEVEGVVTLVLASAGGSFFLQGEPDGSEATSDALFVLPKKSGAPPAIGGKVRVSGRVTEVDGRTVLADAKVKELAPATLPDPVLLPREALEDPEAWEGMRVQLPGAWYINDVYNLGRYGSARLSSLPREFTRGSYGAYDATPHGWNIHIDDGTLQENPSLIRWLHPGSTVRVGAELTDPVGVLDYLAGSWRIHVTEALAIQAGNTRQPRPAPLPDGALRVASYNVLNYFTTLEDRGADSDEELRRQESKIVTALQVLQADVIALMEIENNKDAALKRLCAALNEAVPHNHYKFMHDPFEGLGDDRIKVAWLYRSDRVEPTGEAFADYHEVHHRPPVAVTFRRLADKEVFSAVAVHFKSKGCRNVPEDDKDKGQGCWNKLRVQQAEALLAFAGEVIRESRDPDLLLLGDFNAYLEEDPIHALEEGGMVNLLRRLPFDDRYTYVYKGESGALDHAFASSSLEPRIAQVDIWHINADEPRLLDYNLENRSPVYFRPDPFRSSDHDPVIVDLW